MARAEALARHSKPLSQLLPSHSNRHAVADLPLYASSLAVNPSFAQLAGAKAVGSRHWGLHLLLGDGAAGATIPVSAGDYFQVSLADVQNIGYAEA